MDHLHTFRGTDNKYYWTDILFYFIIPLGISIVIYYLHSKISTNAVNILITSLSILAGLLLNLLAIIFGFQDRIINHASKGSKSKLFLKTKIAQGIHANISFSIILAIFANVVLMFSLIDVTWINSIATFLSYLFLINFFLCLLLIISKLHILLSKEFE